MANVINQDQPPTLILAYLVLVPHLFGLVTNTILNSYCQFFCDSHTMPIENIWKTKAGRTMGKFLKTKT